MGNGAFQITHELHHKNLLNVVALIGLAAVAWGIYFTVVGPLSPIASRDWGSWMYAGQQMNEGRMLYVDVWDHKPPLIFFLNAFGLWITGGSIWGVILLAVSFLTLTVALSLLTLSRSFGLQAAVVGTLSWLLGYSLLFRGNQVEEFALFFQFAALYGFHRSLSSRQGGRYAFMIGAASAFAFLLRQNQVGIGLAVGLYYLACSASERFSGDSTRSFLLMVSGGIVVLCLAATYFLLNGSFAAMWEAAFYYNFVYSGVRSLSGIETFLVGFNTLAPIALPQLSLIAWVGGLASILFRRRGLQKVKPLLVIALVALPIEVLFTSVAGTAYDHYYIAWLPVVSILISYLTYSMSNQIRDKSTDSMNRWPVAVSMALIVLTLLRFPNRASALQVPPDNVVNRLIDYIKETTSPQDYLLIWGAEPYVQFMSDRRSPTRYHFTYPLFMPEYQDAEKFRRFVNELRANPPALIIDSSSTDQNVAPLDAARRHAYLTQVVVTERWRRRHPGSHTPEDMSIIFDYIEDNYDPLGTLPNGWVVYRYAPKAEFNSDLLPEHEENPPLF